jgi:iron complex outermembrane receptor protein
MFRSNLITALFTLLLSFPVCADDDMKLEHFLSLSLEELMSLEITISTDTKQTVAKAPAAVTVITEEDIKATGSTNLSEILESVPGIHVRASQFAFRPLIHFRGANATQTLLMINGVPLRDLMWGFGIFWKGMPTSSIERVEIIRGPGSAMFGADASAGVINVITKTAGKIEHTEIGLRRGSFDTTTGWLQYGANWSDFDIGLTMDFYETDGHDPFIEADDQSQKDRDSGTEASLAPDNAQFGWRNEEIRFSVAKREWRLHLDYTHRSKLETGLTGSGVLDPVTKASDQRFNTDLLYHNDHFHPHWRVDAELRYQDLKYSSGDGFQEYPPGANPDTYPNGVINQMRSAEQSVIFETSGLYTGLDAHSLHLGIGYNWKDLYLVEQRINSGTWPDGYTLPPGSDLVDVSDTPYAFAPEKKRKIRYFFLQDVWEFADVWEFTAGIRHDHYSDFGNTYNPRLALVWESTENLTSKLFYGRAFRPPSFQELYAITSYAFPNEDLKPERSETLELAFSYAFNPNLNFAVNLFQYQQTDFIRAMPSPGQSHQQFTNVGEHTIRGIELEARWQPTNNLRLSGNYTFRNQDNSKYRTIDEPEQDAYLRADWSFFPNWNWNIQLNWIGERTRIETDSRPTLDDYLITDTTLRFSTEANWEFAASVRNLFDEDAREYTNSSVPEDLPLPERSFYAEIRYKFGNN